MDPTSGTVIPQKTLSSLGCSGPWYLVTTSQNDSCTQGHGVGAFPALSFQVHSTSSLRKCWDTSPFTPNPRPENWVVPHIHTQLDPVATRPWNLLYSILSNACSNSWEAPQLSIPSYPQSVGNKRKTIDSFHKNHHIYIFLSWAQGMILINPFLKRVERNKGKMVNI